MIVNWLAKTLAALNSNSRPAEIAAALSFAVMLSLIPAGNLIWIALFIFTFFIRVNNSVVIVLTAVFKLFIFYFDPLIGRLGYFILSMEKLEPLFTAWYNMPVFPLSGFNNTLVAGGIAAGLLLFIPVFLAGLVLVKLYRTKVAGFFHRNAFFQKLEKIPVLSIFIKFFRKVFELSAAIQ
jgi:uncharacterized protein (TIGR03546 family)